MLKELKTFAKDLTVLVVEDDKLLCQQLVDTVSLFFKEVHFAHNGREGLDSYTKSPTDLVITDITMPKMNGVDMSRAMKRIDDKLPIVVVSAHDSFEYISEIVELGIKQFVKKPFETTDLLHRLLKVCEEIVLEKHYETYNDGQIDPVQSPQKQENTHSNLNIETTDTKTLTESAEIPNPNVPKPNRAKLEVNNYKDHYDSVMRDDVDEMDDLLLEMDSFIFLGLGQDVIEDEYMMQFSRGLIRFGNVLTYYPIMAEVGTYMTNLGLRIRENVAKVHERKEFLSMFFEAFIVDLHALEDEAFKKQSGNPAFYNQSIIVAIETILSELNNDSKEEEVINEVEFF